jgi:hypothetical protein
MSATDSAGRSSVSGVVLLSTGRAKGAMCQTDILPLLFALTANGFPDSANPAGSIGSGRANWKFYAQGQA